MRSDIPLVLRLLDDHRRRRPADHPAHAGRGRRRHPLEGAAVYLWHCNRDGQYSMYDRAVTDENYLRGVQASAADGTVTFASVFPACYSGRWPHVHFEV